jgi:uncharacterized OsmC-like protein
VKRIYVTYHLVAAPEHHDLIHRVLAFHADYCPVARSIRGSIEIFTDVEIVDET